MTKIGLLFLNLKAGCSVQEQQPSHIGGRKYILHAEMHFMFTCRKDKPSFLP
jgi:hypothetical protein